MSYLAFKHLDTSGKTVVRVYSVNSDEYLGLIKWSIRSNSYAYFHSVNCSLNGSPVSAAFLREIAEHIDAVTATAENETRLGARSLIVAGETK